MRNGMFARNLAVACALGLPSMLHASTGGEYVYVESNISTPNGNSLYAFHCGDDGSLSPVTGPPFLTGGQGVTYAGSFIGPFDSDHEIITNPQRPCSSRSTPAAAPLPSFTSKEEHLPLWKGRRFPWEELRR